MLSTAPIIALCFNQSDMINVMLESNMEDGLKH